MADDAYVSVEKDINETQKILEDNLGIGKSFDLVNVRLLLWSGESNYIT